MFQAFARMSSKGSSVEWSPRAQSHVSCAVSRYRCRRLRRRTGIKCGSGAGRRPGCHAMAQLHSDARISTARLRLRGGGRRRSPVSNATLPRLAHNETRPAFAQLLLSREAVARPRAIADTDGRPRVHVANGGQPHTSSIRAGLKCAPSQRRLLGWRYKRGQTIRGTPARHSAVGAQCACVRVVATSIAARNLRKLARWRGHSGLQNPF